MQETIDNPTLLENDKTCCPEEKITTVAQEKGSCPCIKKDEAPEFSLRDLGHDPRFQQQNITQRCFVMYTDFYRCEHILGENTEACTWFKDVFKTICPNDWVSQWDELRLSGRLAWHKYKTQGPFPGSKYGE